MRYAGIGSRQTPADVLQLMSRVAGIFARRSWMLHTGGAEGADAASEAGARAAGGAVAVFVAHDVQRSKMPDLFDALMATVDRYHPAPHALTPFARRLHARNAQIILGARLTDPVDFVLCWTPGARGAGGTGQGIRIARAHQIPVFDLGDPNTYQEISEVS